MFAARRARARALQTATGYKFTYSIASAAIANITVVAAAMTPAAFAAAVFANPTTSAALRLAGFATPAALTAVMTVSAVGAISGGKATGSGVVATATPAPAAASADGVLYALISLAVLLLPAGLFAWYRLRGFSVQHVHGMMVTGAVPAEGVDGRGKDLVRHWYEFYLGGAREHDGIYASDANWHEAPPALPPALSIRTASPAKADAAATAMPAQQPRGSPGRADAAATETPALQPRGSPAGGAAGTPAARSTQSFYDSDFASSGPSF